MKKHVLFGLATMMLFGMLALTGCRSSNGVVTLFPGDHNVTVVKKPKRRKIKGRRKAVVTRKYNRARRH